MKVAEMLVSSMNIVFVHFVLNRNLVLRVWLILILFPNQSLIDHYKQTASIDIDGQIHWHIQHLANWRVSTGVGDEQLFRESLITVYAAHRRGLFKDLFELF